MRAEIASSSVCIRARTSTRRSACGLLLSGWERGIQVSQVGWLVQLADDRLEGAAQLVGVEGLRQIVVEAQLAAFFQNRAIRAAGEDHERGSRRRLVGAD